MLKNCTKKRVDDTCRCICQHHIIFLSTQSEVNSFYNNCLPSLSDLSRNLHNFETSVTTRRRIGYKDRDTNSNSYFWEVSKTLMNVRAIIIKKNAASKLCIIALWRQDAAYRIVKLLTRTVFFLFLCHSVSFYLAKQYVFVYVVSETISHYDKAIFLHSWATACFRTFYGNVPMAFLRNSQKRSIMSLSKTKCCIVKKVVRYWTAYSRHSNSCLFCNPDFEFLFDIILGFFSEKVPR